MIHTLISKPHYSYKAFKDSYQVKWVPMATYIIIKGSHLGPYEQAVYIKKNSNEEIFIACLYVDNLLFIGISYQMFHEFKHAMFK